MVGFSEFGGDKKTLVEQESRENRREEANPDAEKNAKIAAALYGSRDLRDLLLTGVETANVNDKQIEAALDFVVKSMAPDVSDPRLLAEPAFLEKKIIENANSAAEAAAKNNEISPEQRDLIKGISENAKKSEAVAKVNEAVKEIVGENKEKEQEKTTEKLDAIAKGESTKFENDENRDPNKQQEEKSKEPVKQAAADGFYRKQGSFRDQIEKEEENERIQESAQGAGAGVGNSISR